MASPTATRTSDPLQGIPLFSGFTDAQREDLRRLLQPRTFEPQRAVFWIGEPGDEFYIVEGGQVVICYPDEGGREVTLAVLGPGQFFGELSLLDGGRRTATARAQGDVRLLSLGRVQFHEFLRRHPSSAVHVLEVLGRRQRDNLDKLRGIKNANEAVEERQTPVQRVVEKVAGVFASEIFLVANLIFFVTWIFIQTVRYNHASAQDPQKFPPVHFFDQPPTFFWLGFMVTIEAIILSVFVLNAQRRQAQRDAINADLDYQVNRKAQLEIMQLHEKLDRLQASLAANASARGGATAPPPGGNGADSES
jgi:CRP/FNR family transcriptional regulator, cyclic AMP receptor protein